MRQSRPPPLFLNWKPYARPAFEGCGQIAPTFIKPIAHIFFWWFRPRNSVFSDPVVAPAWERPYSDRWFDANTLPIVDQPSCRQMQSPPHSVLRTHMASMHQGVAFHADVQRSRLQACQACRDCFDENRFYNTRLSFRFVRHYLPSSTHRDCIGLNSVHHASVGICPGSLFTNFLPRLHRQPGFDGCHIR